jgi:hypothetical protein
LFLPPVAQIRSAIDPSGHAGLGMHSEGHGHCAQQTAECPLLQTTSKNRLLDNFKTRCSSIQIQVSDRPPFQNLPPGVAIDTGAVHPTFVEFFLNSHKALQVRRGSIAY